jgi:hypothetical protein
MILFHNIQIKYLNIIIICVIYLCSSREISSYTVRLPIDYLLLLFYSVDYNSHIRIYPVYR